MGGARIAVKLQSGVSTSDDRSKESLFSINTPRQVRVRLSAGARRTSKTTPRKRTAAPEMMAMGQMPDSPVAINRDTGRTAVGPWCGPFEMSASAADHETPSPTLFMDRAGSVHRSLDGSIMEAKRSRSPNVHAPLMDNSLAVPGALDYPGSNRRAEMRDHSREVRLAASKGCPKGSAEARCAPRCVGNSAKRHAGHQVFQPSGRFY